MQAQRRVGQHLPAAAGHEDDDTGVDTRRQRARAPSALAHQRGDGLCFIERGLGECQFKQLDARFTIGQRCKLQRATRAQRPLQTQRREVVRSAVGHGASGTAAQQGAQMNGKLGHESDGAGRGAGQRKQAQHELGRSRPQGRLAALHVGVGRAPRAHSGPGLQGDLGWPAEQQRSRYRASVTAMDVAPCRQRIEQQRAQQQG